MKLSDIILVISILVLLSFSVFAKEEGNKKSSSSDDVTYTFFNINNISTPIIDNGESDNLDGINSGFGYKTYPKNKYSVGFSSGLFWGGKINNKSRVGGVLNASSMKCGYLTNNKFVPSRIYRVRPDWESADLTPDSEIEGLGQDEIRAQYQKDWDEWPANLGAPFVDKNNNGSYEPDTDIPGVEGADQTIWYIATDVEDKHYEGSVRIPTYLEMKVTLWGYKTSGFLDNVMFRNYKISNKGTDTFSHAYFGFYDDADILDALNDLVGCDTLLNLGYSYNEYNYSSYENIHPAVGDLILDVKFNGVDQNKKMTHHNKIHKNHNDGWTQKMMTVEEDTILYSLLQNINYKDNKKLVDPLTGKQTNYYLPGDPVTGTGWIDDDPHDIRLSITTGSFDLHPENEIELTYANLAMLGKGNLNEISELKKLAYSVQRFYDENKIYDISYPDFKVQNDYDGQDIVIDWNDAKQYENYSFRGYKFQGYNIWQYSSVDGISGNGRLIASLDIVDGIKNIRDFSYDSESNSVKNIIVQQGDDTGLQYSLKITEDLIESSNLLKGKEYNFGVTAYYYNSDAPDGLKVLESSANVTSLRYKENEPGFNYMEILPGKRVSGSGKIWANIRVVNPHLLSGDEYKIRVNVNQSADDNYQLSYDLINSTNNTLVTSNQPTNESLEYGGFDIWEVFPYLIDPSPDNYTNDKIVNGYYESLIGSEAFNFYRYPEDIEDSGDDFLVKYTANGSDAYIIETRVSDAEGSEEVTLGEICHIPLEVWNITKNYRVNFLVLLSDGNANFVPGVNNDFMIYFLKSEYGSSVKNGGSEKILLNRETATRVFSCHMASFSIGDEIRLVFEKGLSDKSEYSFSTSFENSPLNDAREPKIIFDQNYPNPFNAFTTFKFNLVNDSNVKLVIYNAIGQQVKILEDSFLVQGNYLYTFNAAKLASGPYIYRIETDFGSVTKKMLLLK